MAMNKSSRTKNAIYNFSSSLAGQMISILMQFIVRTVFINTLGRSYLGISGLFSNILSMLSLTEFGVGSAIVYKLYEPIAHNQHERIAVLMHFYRRIYKIIGVVVAGVGLLLIPFLPYLIKDYAKLESLNIHVILIFVLYLAKTVSSYLFFAYKSAIVKADQKEYLINLVHYLFTIGGGILQIVCLSAYPKFELYVIISVLQVVLQNIAVAIMANRMYPYICEKNNQKLNKGEVKGIFKDCGALFLYKLNGVVLKSSDNIVISMFLGLDLVALYSNYYVLYTTLNMLFTKIFGALSHGLGNLHTTHDVKHEYQVFDVVCLVTAILGGTACVGIFSVSNEFIENWIGSEWQISQPFAFLMGLELYTLASRVSLSKYRTSMGLFQQAKWRPLMGMVINLVVSIILVRTWGINGVLVGTLVADWTTFMVYDPVIIHKFGFDNFKPVSAYYKKLLLYTVVVVAMGVVNYWICQIFLVGYGWLSVIIHALVCAITVPSALLLIVRKKPEGKYILQFVSKIGKKMMRKKI